VWRIRKSYSDESRCGGKTLALLKSRMEKDFTGVSICLWRPAMLVSLQELVLLVVSEWSMYGTAIYFNSMRTCL